MVTDARLDQILESVFEASGALYAITIQMMAIRMLLNNPVQYAAKTKETNETQKFIKNPSLVSMRNFLLNSKVPKNRAYPGTSTSNKARLANLFSTNFDEDEQDDEDMQDQPQAAPNTSSQSSRLHGLFQATDKSRKTNLVKHDNTDDSDDCSDSSQQDNMEQAAATSKPQRSKAPTRNTTEKRVTKTVQIPRKKKHAITFKVKENKTDQHITPPSKKKPKKKRTTPNPQSVPKIQDKPETEQRPTTTPTVKKTPKTTTKKKSSSSS